jgi:tRNA A-37 threonylcarbamoyl transferase component Bud32
MAAKPQQASGNQAADDNVVYADKAVEAMLRDHVGELFDPAGAGWERIKHNASRTVYRGVIAGESIYLKHFHSCSLVHRFMRRLGSSGAMREMRFSRHLQEHGVPTPEALAATCADGVEWLATRAAEPSQPADAWHAMQLSRGQAGMRMIDRAAAELGRMIGRMHAAGVIHRDLHCGNVLVRTDGEPDGPVRLVLMDLHRASRRRKLSRGARSKNLAQLLHDRYYLTTRTQQIRFLKHYLLAGAAPGSMRGWQMLVEHFTKTHSRRQHNQRDRRVYRDGKYFSRISLPGRWRGCVVLASKRRMAGSRAADCAFTTDQWKQALADLPALMSPDGAQVYKDGHSGWVIRRKITLAGRELDVFIKHPLQKRRWKLLLDCLRPSRPIRAFSLGHSLLTRRIPTALPLVALERRVGPILLDSVLITEAVDAQRLDVFLETWLSDQPKSDAPLTVNQRRLLGRQVLWQLGRLLQRLHDNHFAHRDLKATNLLVRWSPGQSPEIVLVDLDGLKRQSIITARCRFQGLMRLNVSLLKCPAVNRAGRLRMLMGYLRRIGSGRIEFKPYWRTLEDWSGKKLHQQIHARRKAQKAVRRPNP